MSSSAYSIHHRLAPLGIVAILVAVGCRSKIDVKAQNTPAKAAAVAGTATAPAKPVEKKDAVQIEGVRSTFQSREQVVLDIDRTVIDGAPSFTVLNITKSGTDDSKALVMAKEVVPKFGLDDGFELAESANGKAVMRFPASGATADGKPLFFYGANLIKIVANDTVHPRYSVVTVTVADFTVFGVATTAFSSNIAISATSTGKFEGWVNILKPGVVTTTAAGGGTLSAGFSNMINPR